MANKLGNMQLSNIPLTEQEIRDYVNTQNNIRSIVNNAPGKNNNKNVATLSNDPNGRVVLEKLKTKYTTPYGNTYDVYHNKDTDKYYIIDGNNDIKYFTNPNAIKLLKQNKATTISKKDYETNSNIFKDAIDAANNAVNNAVNNYANYGNIGNLDAYYNNEIAQLQQELNELKNPKVWNVDELAKYYGIEDQYNMNYLLNMYNNATDKYYKDAINAQYGINKDSELSNSAYANSLLNKYLTSYNNAAPTAVGKGTIAANALSTLLGADKANEEASSGLNDIVNSYKEKWAAEKAANDSLARERYNELGTYLLNGATNLNTSEVQKYINDLKAYETKYQADRNAQSTLAASAANAYNNNAQAALVTNQAAAANAAENFRRREFQALYGNEWQKYYDAANTDRSITHTAENGTTTTKY